MGVAERSPEGVAERKFQLNLCFLRFRTLVVLRKIEQAEKEKRSKSGGSGWGCGGAGSGKEVLSFGGFGGRSRCFKVLSHMSGTHVASC